MNSKYINAEQAKEICKQKIEEYVKDEYGFNSILEKVISKIEDAANARQTFLRMTETFNELDTELLSKALLGLGYKVNTFATFENKNYIRVSWE